MSTPILPLAVWESGTNQNSVPANDNSLRIQVLNGLVISDSTDAQPGSPTDGDIYIITGAATGAQWSLFDEFDLAIFMDGTWYAFAPAEGIRVNIAGTLNQWNGSAYVSIGGGGGGSASVGVQYDADTGSTADSDPGAGLMKWNNATQASATVLFLDDDTSDGVSLTGWWAALDAGGFCYLQHATDQDTWQIWEVTTVTDAAGYVKLAVTLLANGGSFADGDPMLVTLEQGATSGSSPIGLHSVPIMAGAIQPSVAGGCSAVTSIASAANQPDIVTVDFDPTTQEYAQFSIPMPKSWNEGTITAAFRWSHAATTTNFGVVWNLQAVAVSDDDTIAVSFGTAQQIADTGGTTNDLYITSQTAAITIGGSPAAEDTVFFRVSRVTGDGSDTMAIDARLHSVIIYMTTDASTDA